MNYDYIWRHILAYTPDELTISGAFVGWDNSPRRGKEGFIVSGYNSEKFKEYLTYKIKKTRHEYAQSDFMFMFAWNEWGEGAYLEPDEENGYQYLEALKKAIEIGNN